MFSRRYGVSESADAGMLRWQHEPLHTSLLLHADAEVRRLSVKAFRDVLAFMGDRPLSRPIGLAAELLELGAATPELRDEIFLQVAKQLSGNPSVASAERGWVLMHLALCAFPPSEELENHLELFLRARGALPCVWALHLTLYRGGAGQAGAPSAAEIKAALEEARAPALPALSFDVAATDAAADALDAYAGGGGSPGSHHIGGGASLAGGNGAAASHMRSRSPGPHMPAPLNAGTSPRKAAAAAAPTSASQYQTQHYGGGAQPAYAQSAYNPAQSQQRGAGGGLDAVLASSADAAIQARLDAISRSLDQL